MLLATESIRPLALTNGLLQLGLFALVVCWPTWKTGRMSYVDIGWPWGLVFIGLLTFGFRFAEANEMRLAMVCGLYLAIGGRMGFYAVMLWRAGALNRELARYRYQALRWERAGVTNVALARQVEVLVQGLANASFLAFPAFVIAFNPASGVTGLELLGFSLALISLVLESLADRQKAAFVAQSKAKGQRDLVCDVGLWRYSRHPNYFFEWMVWNGLILMAMPAVPELFKSQPIPVAVLLTLGLLFVSRLMYQTLVHYTGARPSEYYSLQKRPAYAEYQRRTNRFFPGPSKDLGTES
ncbi:MAG: DUF1295 domain-containing protein [Pseudomonadota bacterium]